jgi:DNA-directed RNA polymerase subunit RPC12/RpoP
MSIPNNSPKEYKCNICNKNYSTRQNLWKHNSKYHSTQSHLNNSNNNSNNELLTSKSTQNKSEFRCTYCKKYYSRIDNLHP